MELHGLHLDLVAGPAIMGAQRRMPMPRVALTMRQQANLVQEYGRACSAVLRARWDLQPVEAEHLALSQAASALGYPVRAPFVRALQVQVRARLEQVSRQLPALQVRLEQVNKDEDDLYLECEARGLMGQADDVWEVVKASERNARTERRAARG